MPILEELLKEIKSDDIDEQVKILCDQIFEEEKDKIEHIKIIPKGPNVFLSLEVPGRKSSEVAFVVLERETSSQFIISLWTINKHKYNAGETVSLKKQRAEEVKEFKPEKILYEYAKFIKYMKGE